MLFEIAIFITLLIISNLSVTVYLHRALAHKSIKLNKTLEHFFRISLWMLTFFPPKPWVAVHRYHHKTSDTKADPHSPLHAGVWPMLKKSALTAIEKTSNLDDIIKIYSKDIEQTKLEIFYNNHPYLGKFLLLTILLAICEIIPAIIICIGSILWMILMEERVHVVLSHYLGYRNFNTNDNSKNIVPWAVFLFGEELHNNHHATPNDWNFRKKWYELDPAAIFIQICIWLNLAYPTKNNL